MLRNSSALASTKSSQKHGASSSPSTPFTSLQKLIHQYPPITTDTLPPHSQDSTQASIPSNTQSAPVQDPKRRRSIASQGSDLDSHPISPSVQQCCKYLSFLSFQINHSYSNLPQALATNVVNIVVSIPSLPLLIQLLFPRTITPPLTLPDFPIPIHFYLAICTPSSSFHVLTLCTSFTCASNNSYIVSDASICVIRPIRLSALSIISHSNQPFHSPDPLHITHISALRTSPFHTRHSVCSFSYPSLPFTCHLISPLVLSPNHFNSLNSSPSILITSR